MKKVELLGGVVVRRVLVASAVALVLVVSPPPVSAQEISLVPVSSSGFAATSGGTMHLLPGAQRLTFDIRVAGWDPGQTGATKLGIYQATIDSSGFSSGTTGVLTLPFISVSCSVDADCPNPNPFGPTCVAGVCNASAALIADESRLDFVFHGSPILAAANVIAPDPFLGVFVLDPVNSATDDGTDRHAGTLVLDVPADATGTFTIGFIQDPNFTLFADQNSIEFPIAVYTPAVVIVETDCAAFPIGVDCNTNGQSDACDIVTGVSVDCNGNGVPDECEPDCNNNGIADACDISGGVSADCNGNGVPDSCDVASGTSRDCNADGIPDDCGPDCNANGIADVCDLSSGLAADCNSNGQLDVCDIASGVSQDLNNNGVPDLCEVQGFSIVPVAASGSHAITGDTIQVLGAGQRVTFDIRVSGWDPSLTGQTRLQGYQVEIDSDGFASGDAGVLTLPTIAIPCMVASDCPGGSLSSCTAGVCSDNGAFFVDAVRPDFVFFGLSEIHPVANVNTNPVIGALLLNVVDSVFDDGTVRYAGTLVLDVPADAAGTFSIGFTASATQNIFIDASNFAIPVANLAPAMVVVETGCAAFPVNSDCNANGQDDACDIAVGTSTDLDGNGVPDECELDCNGNGVVDAFDISDGFSADCNGNGIPDECDVASGTSGDCNADGVPDECGSDCNSNGVPDVCDVVNGLSGDCNGNGQLDLCDIATGVSNDRDGNGIPDLCEVQGFSIVPVAASGSHGITGDTIQLIGGSQRVTFDIRVSGWDPGLTGQTRLKVYQATIDSAGFASGGAGVLTFPTIDIPCTVASDCVGTNSTCTAGVCSDNGALFVDATRSDYVFFGLDELHATNTIIPDPAIGALVNNSIDAVIDDGKFHYAGTLVLDVPADASGTFTVGFLMGTQTFLLDQGNAEAPNVSLAPAIVVVRSDCGVGPGTPDCNGNAQADTCDIITGTSQDADGNGIPDECEIAQLAVADGSRFIQVQVSASFAQNAGIVVQCAGGAERFAGFPSAAGNQASLLVDSRAQAAFLPPSGWPSPVSITGGAMMPSTTYSIIVELADGTRSLPVSVTTPPWGDVVGAVAGSDPDGEVDFRDIASLVQCFLVEVTVSQRNRCDLFPAMPDGVTDFMDIRAMVGAFLGDPYPYAVPADCVGP